jgi:replicative DNA helicase
MEAAILTAIMIADGGYDRVAGKLRAEHFSEPLFARMYDEIGVLADAGKPVNIPSVSRVMSSEPSFADIGGASYWIKLSNDSFVLSALAYVDDLINSARRRSLLRSLEAGTAAVADISVDLDETLDTLERCLAETVPGNVAGRTKTFADAYGDALRRIEALRRGELAPGLKVHDWSDWNDLTGGMQPGDYVLIGGRPSMGKTALSLGVARRAAQAGHGVLYVSREMATPQLMQRMIADLLFDAGGRAGFDAIKSGRVDDHDLRLLQELRAEIESWPLVIDDPESLSAGQIGPLIRRHKQAFERRGQSLDLVIIDYLGLIDPPPGRSNRQEEVTTISRTIKSVAKANGLPIIVLSQLSRGLEQREDKRPQLSDLRDSGSLEQDADQVIFVFREEYYLQRAEPDVFDTKRRESWELDMQRVRDRIEIYTAKNRQGDLARRQGYFFGARQAIRNSDFYRSGGGL